MQMNQDSWREGQIGVSYELHSGFCGMVGGGGMAGAGDVVVEPDSEGLGSVGDPLLANRRAWVFFFFFFFFFFLARLRFLNTAGPVPPRCHFNVMLKDVCRDRAVVPRLTGCVLLPVGSCQSVCGARALTCG